MRAKRRTALIQNVIVVSLLLIGFIFGILLAPRQRAVTALPVPTAAVVLTYSGPLTLSRVDTSVLGAETIDPVEFVRFINAERKKVGSPELRLSTTLMKAARMRVDVMKKHQHFSHQDPYEGIELGTVLPKLAYRFTYATENIGMGGVSAPDFVNGFMHSPSHKTNLLDPRLKDTGAAFGDGPFKQYYVNYAVQLFAIPAGPEEQLGYSDRERVQYRNALSAVRSNLHPLARLVRIITRDRGYSDETYRKLTRQKHILESVLPAMERSEPFTNREVTLILEYNSLL